MISTLCVLTCVLTPAQTPDRGQWVISPRLGRSQELVYRGSTVEEATGGRVQFQRSYLLESRVFVLDATVQSTELAVFTSLRDPVAAERELSSARLELFRLDRQGRLSGEGGGDSLAPLDSVPLLEAGMFPRGFDRPMNRGDRWTVKEPGRPDMNWEVRGPETVTGTGCLRIDGVQQSADWSEPRGDSTAWRRRETIWITPQSGVAFRVERTIERREPGRREATHRFTTRYELSSDLQYPGQLFQDRRREIQQAKAFAARAEPLLPGAASNRVPLDALLAQIQFHLERHSPTPYREAVLQVKRRAEAARNGKLPPTIAREPATLPTTPTRMVGRQAADFLATDLVTKQTVRLRQYMGKPVLLVFYHPDSKTTGDVLHFAQGIRDGFQGQGVQVVGLAVAGATDAVVRQREDLRVTFPVLSGAGLRLTYGVEATPHLVLIGSDGRVCGSYSGWGTETASAVADDLRRCLRPGDQ